MRAMSAALLGLFVWSSLQSSACGRSWLIRPDGSGDAPTIQAGIDSASVEDSLRASARAMIRRNTGEVSFGHVP